MVLLADIYYPAEKMVSAYNIADDPDELVRIELQQQYAQQIIDEITTWRKSTISQLNQERTGKGMLFDSWLCRWNNRMSSAKYLPQDE